MDWTEETISHLRSLWQEGLSTAEIGRRLSITKNAVVGKAHRLVLPPRQSPIKKPLDATGVPQPRPARAVVQAELEAPPPMRAPTPAKAEEPAVEPSVVATVTPLRLVHPRQAHSQQAHSLPPVPSAPAATLQDTALPISRRRGQSCCWPLGDPGTKQFRFCGAEPLQGKPYCGEHAQLAYVKLRDRRETVA